LFFFRLNGRIRPCILALVEWKWFDRFILTLIALNSACMAAYDQRAPPDVGFNVFVTRLAEPIFLALFTIEMVLKVIAWGFFLDKRTYLRDLWNWLDFIVVVSAWVEGVGVVENGVGFLRLLRILRPLRSLNAVPQLKVLVNTVIRSVPRLFHVVGVTAVLFVIFGSIGTNLFGGIFFRGCRTSQAPELIPDPLASAASSTALCWSWPYALTCSGYCSLARRETEADCKAAGGEWLAVDCQFDRLCGGHYMCEDTGGFCGGTEDDQDWRIRPRFPGPVENTTVYVRGVSGCAAGLPDNEPCTSRRGYPWCAGSEPRWINPETEFVNFDQIFSAILTIFQCMTMEGWTDIMYYVQDGFGFWVGTIYFFALIPATSFFMLNVALAVVDEAREDEGGGSGGDQKDTASRSSVMMTKTSTPALPEPSWKDSGKKQAWPEKGGGAGAEADEPCVVHKRSRSMRADEVGFMEPPHEDAGEELWLDAVFVRICRYIAFSEIFVNCIMFFIAANVIAMMLETFPPILEIQEPLDLCENIFLGVFCLEMFIMISAMGPKGYVTNFVTLFDGLIVIVSVIQKIVSLTQVGASGNSASAFTALRTLRLFRVLSKLANRSLSFRVLLKAMVSTGASLRYWALLFVLVLYIFTLMWVSFFARRFHFEDPETFAAVSADQGEAWCGGEEGNQDCIPRAHFDTTFWAIATIFQVMTGENWNTIMYAGMRSYEASWRPFIALLFMFLLLFGQILFLSLFLSMLMSKFDEVQDVIHSVEQQRHLEKKRRLTQSKTALSASIGKKQRASLNAVLKLWRFQPKVASQPVDYSSLGVLSGVEEQPAGDDQPAASEEPPDARPAGENGDGEEAPAFAVYVKAPVKQPSGLSRAGTGVASEGATASIVSVAGSGAIVAAPMTALPGAPAPGPMVGGQPGLAVPVPTGAAGGPPSKPPSEAPPGPPPGSKPPSEAPSEPPPAPSSVPGDSRPATGKSQQIEAARAIFSVTSMMENVGSSIASSPKVSEHDPQVNFEQTVTSYEFLEDKTPMTSPVQTQKEQIPEVPHIFSNPSMQENLPDSCPTSPGLSPKTPSKLAPMRTRSLSFASFNINTQRWPYGYAWFVLSERCYPRRAARWILEYEVDIRGSNFKIFDNFILFCILISCIGMGYDTPLNNPDDPLTRLVRESNAVFAYIFIGEMAIKFVALGLFWGKDAYLRSGWNWLDLIVVVVSIVDLIFPGSGGVLKTFRMIRALRPLRVISRNENLKVVVQTMFASIPDLMTLLCVTAFFLLIFALFFLSFLNGTLFHCESPEWLGDEGVKMSTDLGKFATPMCLGSNASDKACPRGRYLVTDVKVDWIDESLPCSESLQRSYCPHDVAPLTVPWKRATWDTPICVGRCNPQAQAKDPTFWANRTWLCEADFASVAELPSMCEDAETPEYVAGMSAEESRGRRFVETITRQFVMPCGGTTVNNLGALHTPPDVEAVSCRAAFCPQEAADAKKQECKESCEIHPHFCWEACASDTSSVNCKACRSECEAQCQCADFCEPLIKDAALCVEQGGKWVQSLSQNFNNIGNSLLTLFEIMSTEGWVDVMYAAADSTGYYLQPRRDASAWMAPFFVLYIFFSFMFLLNLSVGVIVDKFMDLKKEGKDVLLTKAQSRWIASKRRLYARSNLFILTHLHLLSRRRRAVYDFVTHRHFESGIMATICCNTVFMLLKVFPLPTPFWDEMLEAADAVFGTIFLLEFLLKAYALRSNYFKDHWNRFDLFCVLVSIGGLLLSVVPSLSWISGVTSIVRIFRIGRLFRFFQGMNKIFMALVMSIPKLANVLGILLLLLLLFSILGVNLFSTTKLGDTFNVHGNFRNFVTAFITLFRASTGEAWNEIMHDLSKTPEDYWRAGEWCTPDDIFNPEDQATWKALNSKCLIENPNSCTPMQGAHIAVIYWVAYTTVITYMVMNLVVAVILEGYDDGKPTFEMEVMDRCVRTWRRFDPDHRMALDFGDGLRFINEVVNGVLEDVAAEQRKSDVGLPAKRNFVLGSDVSAVKLKFASFWRRMRLTNDGKVSFLDATQQVLRFTVAVYATRPDAELEENSRVEVVKKLLDDDGELSPGVVGTVEKILESGDIAIRWDTIGQRLLPADKREWVAALPLHKLLEDIDNVCDKADRKDLEKLRKLELQSQRRPGTGGSSRSGAEPVEELFPDLDARHLFAIVKIQRAVRERRKRRQLEEWAQRSGRERLQGRWR